MNCKSTYKELKFFRDLNHVTRCSSMRLIKTTSVAEHSYHTAVLSMFLANELEQNSEEQINYNRLLTKALLHDSLEAVTGDLIYPYKRLLEHNTSDKENLLDDIGYSLLIERVNSDLAQLCLDNTICSGSIEEKIVKIADMLELLMYCLEERESGNQHITPIIRKAYEVLKNRNEWLESTIVLSALMEASKWIQ